MIARLDDWFGLTARRTTWSREAEAAVTTWLAMCYILVVNPTILSAAIQVDGVDLRGELITATALAAGVGCLFMGIVARHPFAVAPGMGLNAYFAYSVVLGRGVPWETALGAVFLSGLVFLFLSIVGVREAVVRALPRELRAAVTAGIGLFLAHLGLQAAGLVTDHPATLVTLGDVGAAGPALALLGILVTGMLAARGVRSALLVGILLTTAVAIASGAPVYGGEAFAVTGQAWIRWPVWPSHLAGALDISGALALGLLDIVFVFLFVDFFDTAATLVALSDRVGLAGPDGRFPRATEAFAADAVATTLGALVGTSTTTSYIESAAGIEAGGRTGATAVGVGLLFLGSLMFWPLAAAVPPVATTPALLAVGASMLVGLGRVDWGDAATAIPCLLAMLLMPLTYSISHGIAAGIVGWTVLHLAAGRRDRVDPVMLVLSVLLVARYLWLGAA